jgi:hypothetical protein
MATNLQVESGSSRTRELRTHRYGSGRVNYFTGRVRPGTKFTGTARPAFYLQIPGTGRVGYTRKPLV